jgi:UDP-N-acetylmuramate dehydrogenase
VNNIFDLKKNVRLAPLTTLKIGGNARYFVRAQTEGHVAESVEYAKKNGLKLFILGGGSNVLISDDGFDGLVLQVAIGSSGRQVPGFEFDIDSATKAKTRQLEQVVAGAGENWDEFVACCVHQRFAGIECLSGIPGFVGGTPVQNVGAYGQEISETIVSVRCFDRKTGQFATLTNGDCGFTYRTSIFNSTHRDRYIVLSVTFELKRGGEPKIVYKDLIEYFDDRRPTLAEVRNAVLKIRRSKSMVIETGDPNSKSAGSFFKNPLVRPHELAEIQTLFEHVPFFKFGEKIKIPAAWLIENAGFAKGFALGNAGISTNHNLALINRGDATATEMIELKERIQAAVVAKFGIDLEPEPVFVGF